MIEVRTCARLHFGLLDNNGSQGRLYGSIGLAVNRPRLVLRAEPAGRLRVEGEEADRVAEFARRFIGRYGAPLGAHLVLTETIPAHVGLGSGTQLGLAVGTALAHLAGLRLTVGEIALAVERGMHSGIGIATFQHGGFVLDGGRRLRNLPHANLDDSAMSHVLDGNTIPPLLFRHSVPGDWNFVVAIPELQPRVSGDRERKAFAGLPAAPEVLVEKISRVLLMKMLPALVERDADRFGEALTTIQCMVGDCFASVQGGRYASPILEKLVQFLLDNGAAGAGQSSWGPCIYGLVVGREKAGLLEKRMRAYMETLGGGMVFCVQPRNRGVRVRELRG